MKRREGAEQEMKHPKYPIIASSDGLNYYFESKGPRGTVRKVVSYQQITHQLYNLAFGDLDGEEELDDRAVSNNGDTVQIFATVIDTLNQFFLQFPDCKVLFTGSTPQRTRIYNWIIRRHWDAIKSQFIVFGLSNESVEPYQPGREYSEYVVVKPKLKQ